MMRAVTVTVVLVYVIIVKRSLVYGYRSDHTVLLTLHGRGESMRSGNTNTFLNNLRDVLELKSLQHKYTIVNVGLSDNNNEEIELSSYTSMSYQLSLLCNYIHKPHIWQQLLHTNRIVLIGFSQGGLLIRALLKTECLDQLLPAIDKLITFGSPHSGVFGKPDCDQMDIKNQLLTQVCIFIQKLEVVTKYGPSLFDPIMYTGLANTMFSPASYWNSPKSGKRQSETWLAYINNQNGGHKYLLNKLKAGLILIGFELEATVLPPISASFGYWQSDGHTIIPFNQTSLYRNDLIGLRELDQKNLVLFYEIKNQSHMSIPFNFTYNQFIDFIS